MNFFTDKSNIFEPAPIRLVYLGMGVVSYIVTEVFRLRLRPVFRAVEFNDHGFSDSIGNGGGIMVQIFLTFALLNPNRNQSYRLAAFLSAGYIVYEFAQPYLPKGTFDWNDVYATVLGYLLAIFLLKGLWKKFDQSSCQPVTSESGS